jgi:SAM-dependent methyltransferase
VSDEELRGHYETGAERDRLDTPLGVVEFARTKEILGRHLPPPPATIADVGGGPGRYAVWLAGRGYRVHHRDLIQLHVQQAIAAAGSAGVEIDARVADARRLDLPDDVVDVVLLLGPLYHLTGRPDRVRALTEARRVTRSGGVVFAAAISRWAARLHGVAVERVYERFPAALTELGEVERSGILPPLSADSFSGFAHRPRQLAAEARAAGLAVVDLVNVEGIAFALPDLEQRLADDVGRRVVLDQARAIERVPELLGLGPHLVLTARVP